MVLKKKKKKFCGKQEAGGARDAGGGGYALTPIPALQKADFSVVEVKSTHTEA